MSNPAPNVVSQRFTTSIFDIPPKSLPNPRRVWLGEPGSHEEALGRLSILTPSVVAAAAKSEICTGLRVGLSWDMTKLGYIQFGRQKCQHKIIPLPGGTCFDDSHSFNPHRVFYGGTTREDIMDTRNHRIGLHSWAKEGIAARGILLDYVAYAATHHIEYSTFSTHAIPLSTLVAIAESQNLIPQRGDILFIRTGVIREWDTLSDIQKQAYAAQKRPEHAGVDASLEVLEWIWDSGFAAVAGDAISWEVYPQQGEISVHEYLLAGWGCPIGEMFDLEGLATICKKLQRYSFFCNLGAFEHAGCRLEPAERNSDLLNPTQATVYSLYKAVVK